MRRGSYAAGSHTAPMLAMVNSWVRICVLASTGKSSSRVPEALPYLLSAPQIWPLKLSRLARRQ